MMPEDTATRRRRRNVPTTPDPFWEIRESVSLLEQSQEGVQRQLEQIAQNTNRSITELATQSARQIREITVLVERQGSEFRGEMKTLASEFAHSRQPNYILWISVFMALVVLIGAAYKIVDLQTQVTVGPLISETKVGESDRAELHHITEIRGVAIGELQVAQRAFESKLAEVETQFRASDQARNVQFAEQKRMDAQFANALFESGAKFPPMSNVPYFFPSIANPNP